MDAPGTVHLSEVVQDTSTSYATGRWDVLWLAFSSLVSSSYRVHFQMTQIYTVHVLNYAAGFRLLLQKVFIT